MSQARSRPHHELAQQLDLARRERGLSSKDLARALTCDPRTVRRYLSGDRRPNRQAVELWEGACGLEAGTLTAFHDRAVGVPPAEPGPIAPASAKRARRLLRVAVPLGLLAAPPAVFLLLRGGSDSAGITREAPRTSDIPHHFKIGYTGRVWFRVTPASGHAGDDHRVRLRWGPNQDVFTLSRLRSGGRTLLLSKTGIDDTTFLVKVDPPASVEFAEGDPPGGDARDVPSNWTKRTAG